MIVGSIRTHTKLLISLKGDKERNMYLKLSVPYIERIYNRIEEVKYIEDTGDEILDKLEDRYYAMAYPYIKKVNRVK